MEYIFSPVARLEGNESYSTQNLFPRGRIILLQSQDVRHLRSVLSLTTDLVSLFSLQTVFLPLYSPHRLPSPRELSAFYNFLKSSTITAPPKHLLHTNLG
jgi:hypothetical protein